MRRLLAASAGSALLAIAGVGCGGGGDTTRSAAAPRPSIVVDHSIGPISIGLTEQRVIRRLGRPESSVAVRATDREPGTLARYESRGAELQVVYDATKHVVSIQTYSRHHRTASGVGPGAVLTRAARLPGFRQNSCDLGYWNATRATPRRGVVTVFTGTGAFVDSVLITQLRFDTNCAVAGRGLEPQPNVVVDRSVGGVALDMAEPAVVRLLGKPRARQAGKRGTTVAQYRVAGAPFLVTFDATGRVAAIRASAPFFFTPAGIGPGSPGAFVAALRGFASDPCGSGFWNGAGARASSARPVTVFTLRGNEVASVLITRVGLFLPCGTR